jgi:hypothetical protein
VLLHHADSAFTHFGGILGGGLLTLHGSIFSRKGASSKPGAVHGDEDIIVEEVDNLSQVFVAMQHARPGEADLFVAGDFNLTPEVLKEHSPAADKTTGTGSTLNSSGVRTANLYDHLLVRDSHATSELVVPAQVLDVRKKASTNKMFYKTVSDHLPIVGRFIRNRSDDD